MRCDRAERLRIEIEFGRGSDTAACDALDGHIRDCSRCSADARTDEQIRAAFAQLRAVPDRLPDVRADVLRRIRTGAAPMREEVPTRQLGWATATALATGALLVATAWGLRADWVATLGVGPAMAEGLAAAFRALGRLAGALGAAGLAVLEGLATWVGSLGPIFSRVEPLALAAIVLSYVLMTVTIVYVVRRDFAAPTGESTPGGIR